jgi:hypothetical protein
VNDGRVEEGLCLRMITWPAVTGCSLMVVWKIVFVLSLLSVIVRTACMTGAMLGSRIALRFEHSIPSINET